MRTDKNNTSSRNSNLVTVTAEVWTDCTAVTLKEYMELWPVELFHNLDPIPWGEMVQYARDHGFETDIEEGRFSWRDLQKIATAGDNTYNYAWWGPTLHYYTLPDGVLAVERHLGGDVRGNYSLPVFFRLPDYVQGLGDDPDGEIYPWLRDQLVLAFRPAGKDDTFVFARAIDMEGVNYQFGWCPVVEDYPPGIYRFEDMIPDADEYTSPPFSAFDIPEEGYTFPVEAVENEEVKRLLLKLCSDAQAVGD